MRRVAGLPVCLKVSCCRGLTGARRAGLLLTAIAVLGLGLRLLGLDHGKPEWVFHPDVAKQTRYARFVYHGFLNPAHVFKHDVQNALYPYGTAYLLGKGARLASRVTGRNYDAVHRFQWDLRLRRLGVGLFVGCVLATLLLLWRQLGLLPMALTGVLLMVEPVTCQFNHYGMNDVPLAGMMLLAWGCACRVAGGGWRGLLWSAAAGLAAGLAFGIKYQGILALAFPAVTLLAAGGEGAARWRWRAAAALVAGLGALSGLLITTPLLRADPAHFLENLPVFMAWQANIMETPLPLGRKWVANAWGVADGLCRQGGWLLLPLAAWATVRLVRARGSAWRLPAAALLLVGAVLGAAIFFGRDIVRANDLLPLRLMLILMVGFGLADAVAAPAAARLPRVAPPLIAALLAVGMLLLCVADGRAFARPDTRLRARDWCRINLPAGSRLLVERYVLSSGRDDLDESACRYLATNGRQRVLAAEPGDYLIACSLAYNRFFDRASPFYDPEKQAIYRQLATTCQEVARFSDRPLNNSQPDIVIYRRRGTAAGSAR